MGKQIGNEVTIKRTITQVCTVTVFGDNEDDVCENALEFRPKHWETIDEGEERITIVNSKRVPDFDKAEAQLRKDFADWYLRALGGFVFCQSKEIPAPKFCESWTGFVLGVMSGDKSIIPGCKRFVDECIALGEKEKEKEETNGKT